MADARKTKVQQQPDETALQVSSAPYQTENQVQPPTGPTLFDPIPQFGPPLQPGELGSLGPYRVVKELGKGGMGAVYLGFDERLKRKVALKVMLPKYTAMSGAKERFIREARAAARINHDHIVTIHEADERDGTPYIAMQFLQGLPLDEYVKQKGQLDLPEVLRIGREIALGLAAAHAEGLVHRDIKPANVWLEAPSGRVKILDFGLAKPAEAEQQDTELTASGVVVGTPSYMAPEQARGEKADHRADLFSLGVVLFRLCTGRQPFVKQGMMATLAAIMTEDAPSACDVNPNVPQPLANLIASLLAKNPNQRPESAAKVAEFLQQLQFGHAAAVPLGVQVIPLDTLPTATHIRYGTDPFLNIDATEPDEVVRSISLPAAAPKPKLPKWPLVLLGVFLVGLLALIPQIIKVMTPKGTLVIELVGEVPSDLEVTVKQGTAVIAEKSKNRELSLAVGDNYTIELAEQKDGIRLSTTKFEITRNNKTVVRVSVQRPAAPPPPKAVPLIPSGTPIVPLAWNGPSPLDAFDAAKIPASERFEWQPKELVAVFGTHAQRHWGGGTAMAISPDGKMIATGGFDNTIRLWDADTLQSLGELKGHTGPILAMRYSADGKQIISSGDSSENVIRLWDLASRKQVKPFTVTVNDKPLIGLPCFTANGNPVAMTYNLKDYGGKVLVVDITTQKVLHELPGHSSENFALSDISRDATKLATIDGKVVRVWSLTDGKQLHQWPLVRPGDCRVCFSPDGKLVAATTGSDAESFCDVQVWDAVSGNPVLHQKQVSKYYGMSIAFSPDSKRIAAGGGNNDYTVFEVPSGKEVCRTPAPGGYGGAVFSHDGTKLISFGYLTFNTGDGVLRSYDAATGKPIVEPGDPVGAITGLALAADLASFVTVGVDRGAYGWNFVTQKLFGSHFKMARHDYDSPRIVGFRDGKRVIVLEEVARIRHLDGGAVREALMTPNPRCVSLSPDEKTAIIGTTTGKVEAWDVSVTPAKLRWSIPAHTAHLVTVAFSTDGTRFLTGANDHRAFVWDATGTEPKKLVELGAGGIAAGDGNVYRTAWSPDGKQAAVARGAYTIIWDIKDKSAVQVRSLQAGEEKLPYLSAAMAYHPSLPWLAVGDTAGRVTLWNATTGEKLKTWQFPAPPTDLVFAADGRHLFTTNPNGTVYVLRLNQTTTNTERKAAEWVLNANGVVRVNDELLDIKTLADLPKDDFRLTFFAFAANATATDDGLRILKDCKHLKGMRLDNSPITAAGLAHLKDCPFVFVFWNGLPTIEEALEHLKNSRTLEAVYLSGSPLTDDGLKHLYGVPHLQVLAASGTKVTEAGLKKLAAVRPQCTVEWNGPQIPPTVSDRMAAEWLASRGAEFGLSTPQGFQAINAGAGEKVPVGRVMLNSFKLSAAQFTTDADLARFRTLNYLDTIVLSGTTAGDAALEHLTTLPALGKLYLVGTKVTDTGLKTLSASQSLRVLHLHQTAVTDTGVKALAAKLPECRIEWNGGAIEPRLAAFALEFDRTSTAQTKPLPVATSVVCTVEAWLHTSELEAGHAEIIFGPNQAALKMANNRWHFYTFHGHVMSGVATANTWVHVAGVNDGQQRRLYVDGKLVATIADAGILDPMAKPAPITIGHAEVAYRGRIAAARISTVARYTKDFTPDRRFTTDNDTLALYRFEEGKGDVLRDSSGNGHDATIRGAKWVTLTAPAEPREIRSEKIPMEHTRSLAVSHDGAVIAVGTREGTIYVLDRTTGKTVSFPLAGHTAEVYSLHFLPDGRHLVSGSEDKTVRVWDVAGKKEKFKRTLLNVPYRVAVSASGKAVVSAASRAVWDPATNADLRTAAVDFGNVIAFTPDEHTLVSARAEPNELHVWDVREREPKVKLPNTAGPSLGIAVAPDGRRVALAGKDGIGRVFEMSTGKELARLVGHEKEMWNIAFAADGNRVVTRGGDQMVRLWDATTGRQLFQWPKQAATALAVAANGRTLIVASDDGTVRTWDLAPRP